MLAAMLAWQIERGAGGNAEILIERADSAVLANDVERPWHGISRDRHARSQRLEHHQPESIGAAGKNEHIGRGIGLRQSLALALTEEMRIGITALERGQRRAIADHHLGAGQIE